MLRALCQAGHWKILDKGPEGLWYIECSARTATHPNVRLSNVLLIWLHENGSALRNFREVVGLWHFYPIRWMSTGEKDQSLLVFTVAVTSSNKTAQGRAVKLNNHIVYSWFLLWGYSLSLEMWLLGYAEDGLYLVPCTLSYLCLSQIRWSCWRPWVSRQDLQLSQTPTNTAI